MLKVKAAPSFQRTRASDFVQETRLLIGLPVNKTWTGYGSAIFFEFGTLHPLPPLRGRDSSEEGEFSLMLEWSWRVEGRRAVKFGCWSSDRRIEKGLAALQGSVVRDVAVEGSLPEITVNLGKVLVRSFMVAEGQPAWTLFLPSREWFCVKRGVVVREKPEEHLRARS